MSIGTGKPANLTDKRQEKKPANIVANPIQAIPIEKQNVIETTTMQSENSPKEETHPEKKSTEISSEKESSIKEEPTTKKKKGGYKRYSP
ncbi:Hypothetical predicted protein [Octopus vulgaris]|uniref:Uncharacterized protein n=1 Tax=Octopus vulgaris TaxID=6645 RepID=A0AA36FG37_OCTVU|nr:Hypothetical predicted protein [Octopus vulgaris]